MFYSKETLFKEFDVATKKDQSGKKKRNTTIVFNFLKTI